MRRIQQSPNLALCGVAVTLGIILFLTSLGLYTFKTTSTPAQQAITIASPNSYINSGLFTQKAYMQYTIVPTTATKPDVTYHIAVGNNIVTREDKIIWTVLELDIQKSKLIKHTLSLDEFMAIQRQPRFNTTVTAIQRERNGSYLLIPLLYIGMVALGIMLWKDREPQPSPRVRANYPTTPKQSPTVPLTDEQQALRCIQCPSIKIVNGVLRCQRQTCNFKEAPIPTALRRPNPAPQSHFVSRSLHLTKIGAIPQVFIISLLTCFTALWAIIFLSIIADGEFTFHEPDRLILWGELFGATALTLGGVVMTIIKLREVR